MQNLTYAQDSTPSRGLLSRLVLKASSTSATSYLMTITAFTVFVCVTTRIFTGLRYNLHSANHAAGGKNTGILPYWIPYLGHIFSFFARSQSFIGDAMYRLHDGAFSLNLANFTLHIIAAPSLTKQLLSAHAPVDMREFGIRFVENVWGDPGSLRKIDIEVIFGPIHRALFLLNRDPFVSQAIKVTADRVEKLTWKLVDFERGGIGPEGSKLPLWEQSSRTTMVGHGEATAEFYRLIRDFVGCLALPALVGEKFCENFPNTLNDVWTVDNQVNLLFTGLPRWLALFSPSLSAAYAARDRISKSVAELEDAICDKLDGKEITEKWGDLTDVSNVMIERAKVFRSAGAARTAYGTSDSATLWAMMVNANQVIFWMVWYIYSNQNEGLLAQIRNETADFVLPVNPDAISRTEGDERAIRIDIDGLMAQCPLLMSTFLETMRMKSMSASYKKIQSDFTITESAEDAVRMGKRSGPETYKLPKGDFFCVPNGAHQMDSRYWKEPTQFDPRRFISQKSEVPGEEGETEDSGLPGKKAKSMAVDYGTMTVWGGGPTKCKGQKFAEREVILFVAAIVALWEIEPVGGQWVHPATTPSAGTVQPKTDVMVKLRRRKL